MSDTREDWMCELVRGLAPHFHFAGYPINPDEIRLSCSWPISGARKKITHEVWSPDKTGGSHYEVYISPTLALNSDVAAAVCQSMILVAIGPEQGYSAQYVKAAKAIGLDGAADSTVLSEELEEEVTAMLTTLGDYPHEQIERPKPKKQTTRMLKIKCNSCGCIARMTNRWLQTSGTPTCGCGQRMEIQE